MVPTPSGPLAGVTVADFSRVLAGPYATMLLADMGATVVKVEAPRGDETRHWGPPWTEQGESTYYLSINRNKSSLVLDLADEQDRCRALRLARRADVLVENFRTGSLDRFGLGYEQVHALNPRLVYCSLTGFGAEGGAGLPGYDLVVQAVSGLMSLTGHDPEHPTKTGIATADVLTGLHAALGIVAALRHRDLTGVGQRVELNLLSSMLSGLVNFGGAFALTGDVGRAMGIRHPGIAPYEPLATATRPLVVAAGNDNLFGRLVTRLGLPSLADDPRFATNGDRVANRDALALLLEEVLRTRSADEWFADLTEAGVPCGPINDVGQGMALGESLGLDPIVEVEGSRQVANPIRFSETPVSYRTAPPGLDADAARLRAWLDEPDPVPDGRPDPDPDPDR
jgi:crotonobetainyl-CoA:carnitine CoA-transferase CaiB-like acyl-CoA transferase